MRNLKSCSWLVLLMVAVSGVLSALPYRDGLTPVDEAMQPYVKAAIKAVGEAVKKKVECEKAVLLWQPMLYAKVCGNLGKQLGKVINSKSQEQEIDKAEWELAAKILHNMIKANPPRNAQDWKNLRMRLAFSKDFQPSVIAKAIHLTAVYQTECEARGLTSAGK